MKQLEGETETLRAALAEQEARLTAARTRAATASAGPLQSPRRTAAEAVRIAPPLPEVDSACFEGHSGEEEACGGL